MSYDYLKNELNSDRSISYLLKENINSYNKIKIISIIPDKKESVNFLQMTNNISIKNDD